jgi:isopenicillin N synthase-like dioxygenase
MDPMTSSLPVLDLSRWNAGPAERSDLARQLDAAAREIGFFQIVGHGVPAAVVTAARTATSEYFDLPLEAKLPHRPPSAEINRGYAARGSESLAYSLGDEVTARPPDLFEAFNVGEDRWPAGDPACAARAHDLFAPNVWPDEPAAFRSVVLDYFDAVKGLAWRFADVVAAALGQEDGFFADKVDHSTNLLRIIDYKTAADDPDPSERQVGMGAHSDYGLFTILFADPVPGLQVMGRHGTWHDAVPLPGAFVVNIGDLMAQWTNDRWRSTLHRVLPPARPAVGVNRRRSMAFFFDGNWDMVVAPLASCVSEDNPARYAPVQAGEHLMAKLLGPRTLQASKGASTLGADRAAAADA